MRNNKVCTLYFVRFVHTVVLFFIVNEQKCKNNQMKLFLLCWNRMGRVDSTMILLETPLETKSKSFLFPDVIMSFSWRHTANV